MSEFHQQYVQVLAWLLPPGRAWEGTRLGQLVEGLAPTFGDAHKKAVGFAGCAPPDAFGDLTEDWLRVFGTEELAFKPYPERYVASRLHATGGQSVAHYRDLIARLSTSAIGFAEFRPTTVGMACGSLLYGIRWRFLIEITNINATDVELVRSILDGIKPAHVLFTYRTIGGDYI